MDNNQNLQQQNNLEKDMLEPVTLGTVKKGKTGKPIMAIFIILLIGVLIYFLPVIGSYFEDRTIIDLIVSGELIDFIKNKNNNKNNNIPTTNLQDNFVFIGNNKNVENNNLIISNIQLKDNVFSFDISSKTATYDAISDNLYLQIYVDKETLVYTKALDEVFTITLKNVKENVSFYKENTDYYVILKTISNDEINDIVLSSDESGLASIMCTLGNDTYEYIFQNKELIEMKRNFEYKYVAEKIGEYQTAYQTYNDLKNVREKYLIETSLTEDSVGFVYKENIDLAKANVSELGSNYYPYKTLAKVVNFKQEAKGFDCE